jgi:CubicO group peptidase (beta-lactamase class C family)
MMKLFQTRWPLFALASALMLALANSRDVRADDPGETKQPARRDVPTSSLVTRVDALFSRWDHPDTPGAAVIVIQNGKVLLKKGYGLADLESRRPITSDSDFLLASVTKQFTAMAIMILQERKQLSFDDPLSKFFSEFPAYAQSITVRHLLNHLAGFPEYDDLFVATGKIDKNWPRSSKSTRSEFEPTAKDALRLLEDVKTLRFEPGTKFEYSNSGYVILAQIVEKVSGQRFSVFLHQNIFQPLAMNRSILYDETRPAIPNAALSYKFQNGAYQDINYAPQNAVYGEDNIYTTLDDMFRWDQALYGEKLVRAETLKQAFTPGRLNNGKSIPYGCGWFVESHRARHSGSWLGYRTAIARYPDKQFSVIVLSNVADCGVGSIVDKISEIYLEKD